MYRTCSDLIRERERELKSYSAYGSTSPRMHMLWLQILLFDIIRILIGQWLLVHTIVTQKRLFVPMQVRIQRVIAIQCPNPNRCGVAMVCIIETKIGSREMDSNLCSLDPTLNCSLLDLASLTTHLSYLCCESTHLRIFSKRKHK